MLFPAVLVQAFLNSVYPDCISWQESCTEYSDMWIILMTLISSLDCVLAGVSYSARGIRIPFVSKFLIFMTALVVGCIAQLASASLAEIIPPEIAVSLGQAMLGVMGFFMLFSTLIDKKGKQKKSVPDTKSSETLFRLVIKSAGITIQVLKKPSEADIDCSGRIDPLESVLLSVALTLDSVGLIICSALMGRSTILFPVTLSIGQLAGLIAGGRLGKRISHKASSAAKYLPPVIMIILAATGLIR